MTAKLGDSALPDAPVEGGSFTTSSVGSAIHAACRAVQQELLQLAQKMTGSPLAGAKLDQVSFAEGKIRYKDDKRREVSVADDAAGKADRIEKEATVEPNEDGQIPHIRIRRCSPRSRSMSLASSVTRCQCVAAGRILNRRSQAARSPAPPWGIGMALHEETATDHRSGAS